MRSLRARAMTGGVVWAILTILIGVFGLASLIDNQTQLRFDELLQNRHTQAVIAVANNHKKPQLIATDIGDPAYKQPFSGEYWQVERSDGQIFVSQSLVDTLLPRPGTPIGDVIIGDFVNTSGERLRGVEQWVTFDDGTTWHVQVASSIQPLIRDRKALRGNLVLAFGLIAAVGIVGALLQASTTLQPLNNLRREVAARWDSEAGLDVDAYPTEVAPLVTDINTLLDRNREIVGRSRRQAADLAHAIKTPSAIVRNELEKLRKQGQPVDDSIDALDRLDAQLKRSFARMRADGGNAAVKLFTDVDTSLSRMSRAFTALARHGDKMLSTDIAAGLRVRMDQNDFEEVMGNLLDNGLKWADSSLHISAFQQEDWVEIRIEDDGPGIPEDDFSTATLSGQRLDTSKPGTGLGLAIAADLAHAYGGKVKLGTSERLGGLMARVHLRASGI